ncbi:hypothetical protein HYR69_04105 [Candidatus Sumerlaeota bacterium]|nr:hypothetical protein [Candidatus Sumerlaeota bacterium]
MKTKLDIDDEVLRTAKELARREKKTVGRIISELAPKTLTMDLSVNLGQAPQSIFRFQAPSPRTGDHCE